MSFWWPEDEEEETEEGAMVRGEDGVHREIRPDEPTEDPWEATIYNERGQVWEE